MDFLQKYQHRVQRLISRGGLAIGLPAAPRSMVVDARSGKEIESFMYDSMVAILEKTPSSEVVFVLDQSTKTVPLLSLIRFAHRLDCAITIRSYDTVVDIPTDIATHYIYCVTAWDEERSMLPDLPSNRFCVEVEYNRITAPSIHKIMDCFAHQYETKLVLPEYSVSLPEDDVLFQEWIEKNGTQSLLNIGFVKELKLLRANQSDHNPGYPSKDVCRIDQVQTYIDREYRACPHKPSGDTHKQEIRDCPRLCTSMMLRMPDIREVIDLSNRFQRKLK